MLLPPTFSFVLANVSRMYKYKFVSRMETYKIKYLKHYSLFGQRGGKANELITGPVFYGAVIAYLTAQHWISLPSVGGICCLCVGDGLAEVVGKRTKKQLGVLPWNKSKVRTENIIPSSKLLAA